MEKGAQELSSRNFVAYFEEETLWYQAGSEEK